MRFGLTTPVVTMVPRTHAAWERDAGVAEIRQIAVAADRLGYFHLSCSEHVGVPVDVADQHRGSRYYDPAATLGYIAACTSLIRLLTHVLVLPYHHPLAVAKTYGTLDHLSGGRVILGVRRGERYEDALRALRAALGQTQPAYDGSHYRFAGFRIDPCAVQERLPIWIGGRSPRSLRRALTFAEGWDPFGLGLEQLGTMIERARQSPQWRPLFEIVLSPERPLALDTAADLDATRATVAAYAAAGATAMNLRFVHHSLAHYLECLERFAAEVMGQF